MNDPSTYKRVRRNTLEQLQTETGNILCRLKDNEYLKYKYHDLSLTQTDTMLAKSCGLPKIHKVSFPGHPIISLVNSSTFKLAQFLLS